MALYKDLKNWMSEYDTNPQLTISEDNYVKGANILLRCNSNRNMYNFMMRNRKSQLQHAKLVYELRKHLTIMNSGVTLREIEAMKPKVEKIESELKEMDEQKKADGAEYENRIMKGKREDHDMLPDHIKALYSETLPILRKERALVEKLKLMKDAPPCDRHEYTLQLVELDTKRHKDWELYDSFNLEEYNTSRDAVQEPQETEEASATDQAKKIISIRAYISKNLKKLEELKNDETEIANYTKLLSQIQEKYDMAKELDSDFSDKYKERLSNLGLKV